LAEDFLVFWAPYFGCCVLYIENWFAVACGEQGANGGAVVEGVGATCGGKF